jgi:hypothetical protein
MIHKARDLSADQRVLIENLLGRQVTEDEAISVRALELPTLSAERRREVANELRRYFAEVDANRKLASADEADEIMTEAIRSARPGYRSHQ